VNYLACLIRVLTTLLAPSSGRAWVAGHDVSREPRRVREEIGVVPQALTSDLELTAWQNLDIYGQFYGLSRAVRHARAEHLLAMVGLRERAHDMVATYSGGMRRRLEIARGLIHSPRVLFLDEPTIGLDPQGPPRRLGTARRVAQRKQPDDFADHSLHGRSRKIV
jgi:ABC-2 type transport system ATP-binding protein